MQRIKEQISPALLISLLALFVALGGGAYAALGKNSVGSKQLKKNAVVTAKIKKNAVTAAKLRNNAVTTAKVRNDAITTAKLRNDSVTGDKVAENTLGTVPSAADLEGFSRNAIRIQAASGPNLNDARAAAPEVELFTAGPVTLYVKCFTDTSGPTTRAEVYIKTSQGGVIFDSDYDEAEGNPFLEPGTPETDREVLRESASANSANVYMQHSPETGIVTPDGTMYGAYTPIAVKNGNLPGGDGIYGPGDACLAGGDMNRFGSTAAG